MRNLEGSLEGSSSFAMIKATEYLERLIGVNEKGWIYMYDLLVVAGLISGVWSDAQSMG
jgi:hypothetical protein